MARKGLSYGVVVPIVNEPAQSAIVYGTPVVLEKKLIEANISYEHADAKLYAGNTLVESENGIIGGTVAINVATISLADKQAILGHKLKGTAPNTYYAITGVASPYVGFGFVTNETEENKGYMGHWVLKTQFAQLEDNSKTKGDAIEWQTPTLEGAMMGAFVDESGDPDFVYEQSFATQAEAITWVNNWAGVNSQTVATPTADPPAGAVAAETPVELECSTEGATIYYTTDGSDPTTGSMVYSAPLIIYGPITIKAIAVKAGMNNSAILTAAYTIES